MDFSPPLQLKTGTAHPPPALGVLSGDFGGLPVIDQGLGLVNLQAPCTIRAWRYIARSRPGPGTRSAVPRRPVAGTRSMKSPERGSPPGSPCLRAALGR